MDGFVGRHLFGAFGDKMSGRRKSGWDMPAEAIGAWYFALVPVGVAAIGSLVHRLVELVIQTDLVTLYLWASGLASVGILLLFLSRMPLYRQRRFFVFGSRGFDREHERVYRVAYGFLLAGVLLFIAVAMRS